MYPALYRFILTPKGESWVETQVPKLNSGKLFGLHLHAFLIADSITGGIGSLPKTPTAIEGLRYLLKHGYAKYDARTIDALTDSLPPIGNLRRNVKTYTRIAREEPYHPEDLEVLRHDLLTALKGVVQPHSTEKLGNKVVQMLREAQTKSDKVIAVDSGMQIIHFGHYAVLPTGTPQNHMRDIKTKSRQTVGKILSELAQE